MGTNYYARLNCCDKCGRYDDKHLGKASYGWKFRLQYNNGEFYKTWPEMKEFIKDKQIFDEYGDRITNEAFVRLVESKQRMDEPEISDQDKKSLNCRVVDRYIFYDCEFS